MTATLLRLFPCFFLFLSAWPRPSESHGGGGGGGGGGDFDQPKDYEVVRPIRLHSVRRRDTENVRPETINYAMTLAGRNIEIQLEKNSELVTNDYTETHYKDDGTQVTTKPSDIDHCYYHGRIVNDSQSSVSISTCDGLRGYFRTSAQRYLIEPLSASDQGDHAVTTFSGNQTGPAVCGVTNTSWSLDFEPPTGFSRSRSGRLSIVRQQKYIELFLVADKLEYLKMKRDQVALRKRIFEIVNFVNMVYKPLRTFVALVGLEIWSNHDLISVTPPAGANLDAFMNWRNSELMKRKKHDNAHLISGIDFEGATVGLAFIGTLCSDHSVGVVQDHNNDAIAVGATLAHEMGHNLGMNHDDSSSCVCAGESCIMAAALSWNIPRSFSSCSSSQYERYLRDRSPSCLLDKPDRHSVVAPPVCGNRFVEEGEQCDCGTVQECTNPCCNATTCTLTEGSMCSEGECCHNCKILSRFHECRSKQDECDLAEYCDGQSATCPENMFAVNGLPCDRGLGYCYNGNCPQRKDQCVKMYGPAAIEATDFCYQQNTRGLYYGFCKRLGADHYIACQPEDVLCGKLFCHHGNANPNYGRMVTVGNCKASFYDDHTKDYGQVDAGTRCGDGMVCSLNQCVDLQVAYRNTNCSARCSGHGVCNHKNECWCEPGWLPPNCDVKDKDFNSGISIGVIVGIVALVVLGIIAALSGYIWKKWQRPKFPTSHRGRPAVEPAAPRPYTELPPAPPKPLYQAPKPKPKGPPPPPPPAGNRPKPPIHNYTAARQALRPVPPPKV